MKTNDIFQINEDKYYSVYDELNFEDVFTYHKIKTNKQITYYNDVIAFDIETSSFKEETQDIEYKDDEVYSYIRGIKIKIPQSIYSDLPDFNDIRRSLFGKVWFSKTEGISIDSLYHELNNRFPYYFPDDIYNQADELEQIIQVFIENSPEEIKKLNEYQQITIDYTRIDYHYIVFKNDKIICIFQSEIKDNTSIITFKNKFEEIAEVSNILKEISASKKYQMLMGE